MLPRIQPRDWLGLQPHHQQLAKCVSFMKGDHNAASEGRKSQRLRDDHAETTQENAVPVFEKALIFAIINLVFNLLNNLALEYN